MFLKIYSKFLRKFSNIFANFFKIKKFSIAPLPPPPPVERLATALEPSSINKTNPSILILLYVCTM